MSEVYVCGVPRSCPKNDGADHVWDGPSIVELWPNGNLKSEAVTCSKCGADFVSWALWNCE